jgi:hypothetical protein
MNVLGDAYIMAVDYEYSGLGLSIICRKKLKDKLNGGVLTDHYRDSDRTK